MDRGWKERRVFASTEKRSETGELGIKHIYTRIGRQQTNGKIESFFKIMKKEFFGPNKFESIEDLILNLGNYLFEFNHLRRHGGLNYDTPFDKLRKVAELLS